MGNKLQIAVAITNFFFLKDLDKFNSKSHKNNVQKGKHIFVFTLGLFLLISGKGFSQLNETFDGGIPDDWTVFGNDVATSDWSSSTDGYLSTNGVSINPSNDNIGDQNTAQYFLVTPQFAVPENGEIHFYTKQTSEIDNGAEYQIRLSTAAQPDINGFNVIIQSYNETNLNNGLQTIYEKKVIEIPEAIPTGFNIYLAFVVVNTQNGTNPTGDEWFVDEFSVLEGCIEVNDFDVVIENVTTDGADLSWSHPSATNFEIQILPSGGIPAASGIPVTGTNYSLTNLDEETEFDVYISAICDNSTMSTWTGPITFETLKLGLTCDEPIVLTDISTAPYILIDNLQNFTHPDPDAVSYSTAGSNCVPGNDSTNYLNGNLIFHTYTPTEDGLLTATITTATQTGGGDNQCWNDRISLFIYEDCSNVGVNCTAGIVIEDSYVPTSISNLLVQQGQTYVIVVSSELSTSAGICFQLEISSPTCAPPSDFVYNNLIDTSVNFSWDNVGNFSDSWEYQVVSTGSGEPTTSGIATSTNINVLINSGLVPGTTYDLYVRSICGGSPGIWSVPYTFTTQCSVFNTPYFTDFTGANVTPEPCWTSIDINSDGNVWGYLGSSNGYATLVTRPQEISNDMLVSPQINFDGIPKRVRYKHRATQGISTYTLKLSTTGVGIDNFTTIILPEIQINNTGFQEIIVDIPENITGNVNIAWVVEPNTSETAFRLSIDDVFIEDKPACPDPLNPFTLNIQTNSAWFAWTVGDEETQWQVAIQDAGTGVPVGDGVIADSNFPYIASDLQSGHRYEYYVRAYCNVDEQSNWIGPVAFTTLCESYDTPFFESFDDEDPNTQKFCWKIVDQNSDDALWIMNENEPSLQNGGTYNDYIISPQINVDGVKELKFKYRAKFSFFTGSPRFGLEVLMSTTNTNPFSFTVISPLEIFTNTEYQEKSIIIEANGPIYIAFRVPPEFTGGSSVLNIDDVSITDAPACPNPSDLSVDNILIDGANVSWSAGYLETAWNVVVQPAGSGIPTTSGVPVTLESYSPTGLMQDTEYEFYVMADCGSGDSEWVGPISFKTLCTAFPVPFNETFNSDSDTESCWIVLNENDDLESWELDSASFVYEGDQAAAMFTGQNGINNDWLISPTITIPENQRLRYYYRVNDSFFTEDLEVLLSTNGIGLDQFTTVLYDSDDDPILINNVEYKVKIINLPDGITGNINIAFHVPFFVSANSYRGQTLVIDNVIIEDIPECPEPTNIVLNNITDTSVQVAWDANGTETAWEISVQPAGTPPPIGDTDPSYLFTPTANPFTVTGLLASTMYDIYVRAVCDGVEGSWTGPVEVTTKCSFDDLCLYTFVLTSDSRISAELDITQNNQISQSLEFNGNVEEQFPVFLCSGVEFSVFFDSGTSTPQYADYQFEIIDNQGITVYLSPLGLDSRTIVYSGTAICGVISCPQPIDLAVSDISVFSWTSGGGESQWEVAIQPIENGTIPQSGTIVATNSYTPTLADFNDPNAATYEYFVRAICGADDKSYWSGPFAFVRNDDVSMAVTLPINLDEDCIMSGTEVSFTNTTVSSEVMSCDGVNQGDIWFEFVAESTTHIIESSGFTPGPAGNFYHNNGDLPYPDIITTLYRDNSGTLEEITCTYDKVLVAMYVNELIVGDTYKIRLTLNTPDVDEHRFKICITTPIDPCSFNLAVNGDFEEPALGQLSGVTSIVGLEVVPGWRQNLDSTNSVFIWEALNAPGFEPYEGGQCIQLLTDHGTIIDPNDPDVKGLYRDFESSEITLFDYSFAHLKRIDSNIVQLFAGPPGGPYSMINEHSGNTTAWELVTGTFQVPDGQSMTRFIFRAHDGDDIGNILDAISFIANNEIITTDHEVDCNGSITNVEAEGVGTWIASDANPSPITFDDANNNSTSISGFLQPGIYSFTWRTRYCENDIEITYNGIGDIPTTDTLVEYCLNSTAQPLTATATGVYTLLWYTQATGGAGSITPPTPDTTALGNTSYYVVNVDTNNCEGPRVEIIVNVSDSITSELTFSYSTTCEIAIDNPAATLNNGFTTGGIFTSTTLTVDASTGEIDITSASGGVHNVLYTYDGDASTCMLAGTYTATIEFLSAINPVTTFDYGSNPFCLLVDTSALPNLLTGFTNGGVFSSTTLTVDATSGEIDFTSANSGMHDVLYTYDVDPTNCIQAGSFTTTLFVTETLIPVTMFTYTANFYCTSSDNVFPNLATDFMSGGLFSAEAGLTIDTTTGELNLSTSIGGNYTITYQILEDLSNCIQASTSSFIITVLDSTSPVTNFNYGNDAFCMLTGGFVLPNLEVGFTNGGVFSSTTINVDAATGGIDLTSVDAGTHSIFYTYDEDPTNCILAGLSTTSIEVIQVTTPITTFIYTNNIYCADSNNILPELDSGFTTGGVFSAETGLSINAATGEINVSASSLGNYTVSYEIIEDDTNCIEGSIDMYDISILDTIEVAIEGACNGDEYWLTALPINDSYNPNEVNYIWMNVNGDVVGENSETFNVTQYVDENQNVTIPTQLSVTIDLGDCSTTTIYTIDRSACREIPRGISPDGNGKNDTFDLSGYGVTNIQIFNRLGKKVFSHNGNYTNQWYGQSNNGSELPDGTYFYSIQKQDGSSVTGWVFINRVH